MPKTLITPFIYHPDAPSSQPNPSLSNPSFPEAKPPRRSIFCIPTASFNPFKRFRTHKDLPRRPYQPSEVIQSYDGFCNISSSKTRIASDMWCDVSCMADRYSIRSISASQISTAGGDEDVTKDESEDANVPNSVAIDFREGNTPVPARQANGKEMGNSMATSEIVFQDKQAKDAMWVEVLPNSSLDKGQQIVLSAFSEFSPSESIKRARTSLRDISPSRPAYSWNNKRKSRKLTRSNAIRRYKR